MRLEKNSKECIVVVPIYKNNISYYEYISIKNNIAVLNNYEWAILCPETLVIDENISKTLKKARVRRFKDSYFDGIKGYNSLMLSIELYETFSEYEYILICQTDVFVIKDDLSTFLSDKSDYIGAPSAQYNPWEAKLITLNGGFSLRHVKNTILALKKHAVDVSNWNHNEDLFFSWLGRTFPDDYRLADVKTALTFSFNEYNDLFFDLNDHKMPMAIHCWYKYDVTWQKKYLERYLPCGFVWPNNGTLKSYQYRINEFILKSKRIYIFGAGDYGRMYRKYIQSLGKDIEAFIISNDHEKSTICDKHVYCLSELQSIKDSSSVIVAISPRFYKLIDIKRILNYKGFQHIYDADMMTSMAIEEKLLKDNLENS